jgi:uroporphyrinogen-III synthase
LTSANAARAAAAFGLSRDLPVYAVGDATGEAARTAGFRHVESARGDVRALAALIRRRLSPADGAVLHLRGEVVAGRLAEDLRAAGFEVRKAIGYRARPVARLPEALARLLREDGAETTLKAIMIFSPRTAETFVTLVERNKLADRCTCLEAACLSPAVAERLRGLDLHGVRTAPTPDRAGMLAALDAAVAAAQAELSGGEDQSEQNHRRRPRSPGGRDGEPDGST